MKFINILYTLKSKHHKLDKNKIRTSHAVRLQVREVMKLLYIFKKKHRITYLGTAYSYWVGGFGLGSGYQQHQKGGNLGENNLFSFSVNHLFLKQ